MVLDVGFRVLGLGSGFRGPKGHGLFNAGPAAPRKRPGKS